MVEHVVQGHAWVEGNISDHLLEIYYAARSANVARI